LRHGPIIAGFIVDARSTDDGKFPISAFAFMMNQVCRKNGTILSLVFDVVSVSQLLRKPKQLDMIGTEPITYYSYPISSGQYYLCSWGAS
jgi:hypothetical protein